MSGINLSEGNRPFTRDQILTIGDLEKFKTELLVEIKNLVKNGGETKQWLRSKEVRKMLNISPGTLQTFRVNGTLSYTRLGTVTYYKYEDIIKHLEQNMVKSKLPRGLL